MGRKIVKRRYIVRGTYPFLLMSKGDRNMRREISREMSHGEYDFFHQFQRGRLLES
jgi:hypothetical protein